MERESGAARRSRRQSALLDALFGNSPYLTETALQNPTFMTDLWRRGPDAILARSRGRARRRARRRTRRARRPPPSATSLRRLKRRVALDCRRRRHCRGLAARQGDRRAQRLRLGLPRRPHRFDPAAAGARRTARHRRRPRGGGPHRARHGQARRRRAQLLERHRPHPALRPRRAGAQPATSSCARHFVRGARLLVQLMSETSADGYIFRTDLRLRPDPGSTPLAMSVQAAELYYESVGQNWERAAMIKAHPVAGNRAVGAAFLADLHALHLAQASRLRGDPRHPFDQAPDRRPSRRRRGQGAGPQRQAGPRRHPRDRVLRPDPAAHLRRPQSRRCGCAAPARRCARWPRRATSRPRRPTS